MPFSGVIKSGGGSISQAGGAGRGATGGGELQPALASSDIALKLTNAFFSFLHLQNILFIQISRITQAHFQYIHLRLLLADLMPCTQILRTIIKRNSDCDE